MSYPMCLVEELAQYGQKPTYNLEWDRSLLDTLKRSNEDRVAFEAMKIANVIRSAEKERRALALTYPDLTDEAVYSMHAKLFLYVANEIVLRPQRREFVVDDNNRNEIRFLLLYFNNCPAAEEVFPGRGYKLHKNIMLQGGPGVGKTMLMQCFSEYLRRIKSPRFFRNLSVTQMVNSYTIHNSLDRYTFNEEESKGFQLQPQNICLNDVGLNDDKIFFGTNTSVLTDDFLLARNDIWAAWDKFAHITTNLDNDALKARFNKGDAYGRIIDRFKTYNVIPMQGSSRR